VEPEREGADAGEDRSGLPEAEEEREELVIPDLVSFGGVVA
jgi:hypothetical protein